MEQYKKNENPIIEIPPVQPSEVYSHDSESNIDQLDKASHTSEQSGANIFSGLNNIPVITDDSATLPTVVDSSDVSTDPSGKAKKISVTDSITASDKDLIEKVWVDKAKAIIENSQGDPYKKNANLTIVKDQYKSARFNKLISNK